MSFIFKGATISARELTIEDDDRIIRFSGKLPDGAIVNSGNAFAEFVIGGVVQGGESPIPAVASDSSADDVAEAYEAWKALPRSFLRQWRQEIANADTLAPKA